MSAGDQGSSAENSGHLPQFYLVSGLWDKEKGIKPGTVRPIIDTVVAIDDGAKVAAELVQDDQGLASSVKGHKESLQVYITDGIGRLCNFDTGKEDDSGELKTQTLKASADVKAISENAKLYFPPKRAILYNLLSSGYNGWVDSLRNLLKQIETKASTDFPPSISLAEQLNASYKLKVKDHFIKPEGVASSASEQAYARWYEAYRDVEVPVLVLPRIRGIAISFSSDLYRDATVTIRDRSGKLCFQGAEGDKAKKGSQKKHTATVKANKSGHYSAVFYDTDDVMGAAEKIQDQIFRIEVVMPPIDGSPLSEKVYSFAERLRFKIRNIAGDFELINGDALSLEESIVKQFPALYSKKQIENEEKTRFAPYVHFSQTSHGMSAAASSVLGASSGQQATMKIGQHLVNNFDSIGSPSFAGVSLKDVVGIAFSVYDIHGSYADCMGNDKVKNTAIVNAVTTQVHEVAEVANELSKTKLGRRLSHAATLLDTKVSEAWTVAGYSGKLKQIELPKGVQNWLSSSQDFISSNKIMDKLDIAGGLIGLASATHGVYQADMNQDKAVKNLRKSVTAYAGLINLVPTNAEDSDDIELTTRSREALKQLATQLKKSYQDDAVRSLNGDKVFVKVNFAFDRFSFDANKYEESVAKFVEIVNQSDQAESAVVHLVGHTCDIGSSNYNQNLSEQRAVKVAEEMSRLGAKFKTIPSGRGADDPGDNLSREQRRRVEAVIEINQARCYYPSREGMDELERYRALAMVYGRAENEQIAAGIKAAIDLVLCIPAAPVIAAKLIWEGAGLLMDAAAVIDKLVFGSDYLNLIKSHDNQMVESRDNLISMIDALDQQDPRAAYLQSQYQLRAESLYGLMRLLTRCAIETETGMLNWIRGSFEDKNNRTDFSYQANIKYYRVEEYIDRFVLNDGWQLPKGMLLPITLDQHWIQIIEDDLYKEIIASGDASLFEKGNAVVEKHTGQDIADIIGLVTVPGQIKLAYEKYKESQQSILFNPIQGIDYIRFSSSNEFQKHQDDVLTAQYQSYFPIHYRAAKDIEDFSAKFKNDFSGIDEKAYSFCNIGVRKFGFSGADNVGWQTLEKQLAQPAGLSPLDQIRISVFLDYDKIKSQVDDGSIRYMPVQVMPVRRDGFNIDGVPTKDFIQKIEVKKLTDYEKLKLLKLGYLEKDGGDYKLVNDKPLYGCIVTPFYTYGVNRLYGTRPMAGSLETWLKSDKKENQKLAYEIDSLFDSDGIWEMDYAYEVMLANRSESVKGIKYSEVDDTDEFTMRIDPTREHSFSGGVFAENKILRPHFLQSRTEREVHPELFINAESLVLFRNSKAGKYLDPINVLNNPLGNKYAGGDIAIESFDWAKPVEIILIVVADDLNVDEYKELNIPWKSLPVSIKVTDGGVLSSEGPAYRSKLKYIGTFSGAGDEAKFEQDNDSFALELGLAELSEYFKQQDVVNSFSNISKIAQNMEEVESGGGIAKSIASAIKDFVGGNKRYVFATHISLTYQAITGERREGVRPYNVNLKREYKKFATRLGFKVSTPGDSGFSMTCAEGVYRVEDPVGFEDEHSHWYPKPKKSKQILVEELFSKLEEDKATKKTTRFYNPEIMFSHWAEWSRLSLGDKWWNALRQEELDKWLNKQGGNAELPGGLSLLM